MDVDLSVIDTDNEMDLNQENIDFDNERVLNQENPEQSRTNNKGRKKGYKKPQRPCLFCNKLQARLKRHILTRHKNIPEIAELLKLEKEDQERHIDIYRKEAIQKHNIEQLNQGQSNFLRQRDSTSEETPVMCSGCKGFYAKGYKSRLVIHLLRQF